MSNIRIGPSLAVVATEHHHEIASSYGSDLSSDVDSEEEELDELENLVDDDSKQTELHARIRKKLCCFFMNPIKKFKTFRRFPIKMMVQLAKIILVTSQLILFGEDRAQYVKYVEKNSEAINTLFIRGYTKEVGKLQRYLVGEIEEDLLHVVREYYRLEATSIAAYDLKRNEFGEIVPMTLCQKNFQRVDIYPNLSFVIDADVDTCCISVNKSTSAALLMMDQASSSIIDDKQTILEVLNMTIDFHRLIQMTIDFSVVAINVYEATLTNVIPDCIRFDVTLVFDNSERIGFLDLYSIIAKSYAQCMPLIIDKKTPSLRISAIILDSIVLLLALLSTVLCLRSQYNAWRLKRITCHFFRIVVFRKCLFEPLNKFDHEHFSDQWLLLIVVSDLLIIIGTIFEIFVRFKVAYSIVGGLSMFEAAALALGSASLLVWFSVLRYLSYWKCLSLLSRMFFQLLVVTLKRATMPVLRFFTCALVFFLGFLFCGWIVLGPYSSKFRSMSTTAECLFSLINGDDMYPTFTGMPKDELALSVWLFSRIYLYSFVALYIYVVLSLFIAIIIDTYEAIKESAKQDEANKSILFFFIENDQIQEISRTGKEIKCAICDGFFICKRNNKVYPSKVAETTPCKS